MSKARSGSGSIRQRKTGKLAGKWRLQWNYDDPLTGEAVTVDKTFPTEGEAQDYLDDLKAKLRTGQMILDANSKKALTLNAWFDELAGKREVRGKNREVTTPRVVGLWEKDGTLPNTVSYRIGRYDKYVRKSPLGEMPLKFITAEHARSLFRGLTAKEVGQATLKTLRTDLVKLMNDAIETYERLPYIRNPFRKVKVETPEPREAVALSVKNAKKAIARQETIQDRAMLGLYLLGGLRLSEQMAICKEQIDYKKGIIVVDRAVKLDQNGQQTVGLPKGGKPRLVVMCPSLAALLCPLMDGPRRYLFPCATEDKPRMKKLVYATWRKIRRKAKYLPATMKLKDCRLSHNNWIEKLMPSVSLSTRLEHMGHSTDQRNSEHRGLAVNLTNYTRFLSEAHDRLRQELESVLGLAGRPMLSLQDEGL